MIDTIAILLLRGDTTGNWDIEQMANRLDEDTISITTYNNGSSTINGMIKNMKVYITPYYVKVIGSLNKYYCGNNLETLAQDDIVDAIVLLSEDLELPLERGFIRRIDVARNIVVKKNVEDYINSFEETDGYHRDKIDERVLYKKSNARHSMTIYDKVKELKANDRELYQYNKNGFLKNKKILRFEVKLERQLKQQLKYKSVRVVHLRSKSFLKKLNDFWYMKYKTIATKKQFKFSKDVNNYADFKKELLIKVIHEMGVTTLYKMLESLRKEGNLSSNQKRYAKEDIKKLISANSCLVELDLNVELMTRMNFLYQNLDKDEFVHLKNQIIRKDIDPKPKNHLQRKVFAGGNFKPI